MAGNTEWQVSGDIAERYETHMVPVISVPWAEAMLQRAVLRRGEDILDVACGTGIVVRMATETVGPDARITGADIDDGMLAVAARIAPEIEWVHASADDLPFEDQSFDAIFCQQGLQFFPDKVRALSEFRRVLRPQGRVVLCVAQDLTLNPLMSSLAAALTRHFGKKEGDAIRAVCALSDAGEIDAMHRKAGFFEVAVDSVSLNLRHPIGADFVRGALAATPVAEALHAMEDTERDAVVADVLAGFGEHYDGKALAFPYVAHIIVARP